MAYKFRWPFRWPRRNPRPGGTLAPLAAASPESPPAASALAAPRQMSDATAPVQLSAEPSRPPRPVAPAAEPDGLPLPDSPDLGLELLGRLPAFSNPPTLGRMGGLPAMAQTLPTVERFLRTLPTALPPTLPGLGEAAKFAADLPSLAGFTDPDSRQQPPAFPAQLDAPSEPTDVLAPPGGMPGQVASLSGAAAVLEPGRPAAAPLIFVPTSSALPWVAPTQDAPVAQVASAALSAVPAASPVQRAADPESPRHAAPASLMSDAAAPPPLIPGAFRPELDWAQPPAAPMTHVLSPEQTLTGNVLPAKAPVPIQREVLRAAHEGWSQEAEFIRPLEQAGERVSPQQRASIEGQRGQGRPLEPETRQHFEQAYGQPLDNVRIHTGPSAHSTAQSLNAIAFASGSDLFFTENTYEPHSAQGLSLIGHELAHVIQQQYGVPGEADELRPPDDHYERQADQLAARALDPSLFDAPLGGQPRVESSQIQRAEVEDQRRPGHTPAAQRSVPAASAWAPGEQLRPADIGAQLQPLAVAMPLTSKLPEEQPIQRFAANQAGTVASGAPSAGLAGGPLLPTTTPAPTLSLENTPRRAGRLIDDLLSPLAILSNRPSLAQNLPGLGLVGDAVRMLPVFRSQGRSLPSLGSLPDLMHSPFDLGSANLPDTSSITGELPNVPGSPPDLPGLGANAPAMPNLGGVAQSLAGGLPALAGQPFGEPAVGGLTPPEMPLAQVPGAVGAAANGALDSRQPALGTITGMAPSSGAEPPAAPALPSLDKLTEHIWKEVQRKLKIERERSRGLA